VRRTAKILSELHPVSKSSVHRWIKKFEERLPIITEKKRRKLIAIDETFKANGEKYYVYAAIDVERNKLIYESLYNKKLSDY
jgi:putative transposase